MINTKVGMILLILLSLALNNTIYADGGGAEGVAPPNTVDICRDYLDKTQVNYDGPMIKGHFTASAIITGVTPKYIIHVTVEGMKYDGMEEVIVRKLYQIKKPITANSLAICEYTDKYLMEMYRFSACKRNLVELFGYSKSEYYPVLTNVRITQRDQCTDANNAMISGTINIRISPIIIDSAE